MLGRFLEEAHLSRLDRDPELRRRAGLGPLSAAWPDRSPERTEIDRELLRRDLYVLETDYPEEAFEGRALLDRRLFELEVTRALEDLSWRDHAYIARPEEGLHVLVPGTLLSRRIADVDDASAWIALASGAEPFILYLADELEERESRGLIAPRFAHREAGLECDAITTGYPFRDSPQDSALYAHFLTSITALTGLSQDRRERLLERAVDALRKLGGAYERLSIVLEDLERAAGDDHGVWSLPDGETYYRHRLGRSTTLDVRPEEVDRLARELVVQSNEEIRRLARQLDHPGGLASFLAFLRDDAQFYEPPIEAGRARLLGLTRARMDVAEQRAADLFRVVPGSGLRIERGPVGGGENEEYVRDGRTGEPALWRVDLRDPRRWPRYAVAARAHRTGWPGRHLRVSLTEQIRRLPSFRRTLDLPAWSEGWDLYAARVAGAAGWTEDPYELLGHAEAELWAAALAVIDVGVHHDQWSRREAADWLDGNTCRGEGERSDAIDRVLLHPGDAAAGVVGLAHITELEQHARTALDTGFDVRRFHAVVLGEGPLPLDILEERVEAWIGAE